MSAEIYPFSDRSAAFAFPRNPAGIVVLGRSDWYAFELVTSLPRHECHARYATALGISEKEAGERLTSVIETLTSLGLVGDPAANVSIDPVGDLA